MKRLTVGIDTSCYTTSVACVDESGIVLDERTVLCVPLSERGLRQSDGLFQHVKNLPVLIESVMSNIDPRDIASIGVSVSPTAEEGSYMPVFLAGLMQARALAAALRVPLIETNHQRGHLRAALVDNEELIGKPFYAIHLSGGTTDLLSVSSSLEPTPMGSSTDIHAGQLVDRIGVLLGCSFPCGKQMEKIAVEAVNKDIRIPSSVHGLDCSLSGAESAIIRLHENGEDDAALAYAVYDCLSRTLTKLIGNLISQHGKQPVLLCGGVASSALLRKLLLDRSKATIFFSKPALASDNAVGVALIANSINA